MLIDPFYLCIIFFIFIWIITEYGCARMCDWSTLAAKYRCEKTFVGEWKPWCWGLFGALHQRRILWVGIAQDGIYLKTGPPIIYRAFHPPLFIPWSAIESVQEEQFLLYRVMRFKFTDCEAKLSLQPEIIKSAQIYLGGKLC